MSQENLKGEKKKLKKYQEMLESFKEMLKVPLGPDGDRDVRSYALSRTGTAYY